MLGVDEGGYAALTLGLGHRVQGHGRLAARFGAEDLDDPAAWKALAAQSDVEAQGAGGNPLHVERRVLSQLHDGALAELFLDELEGALEFAIIGHDGFSLYRGVLQL